METVDFAPEPAQDEMDLAEELADTQSDPAFAIASPKDLNDYIDVLAELYATATE